MTERVNAAVYAPLIDGDAMQPDPDEVFTIDELAIYLKISKSTLYKLAQEGKVPGQKIGKHWRFKRGVINRWLESPAPAKSKPR